MRKETSKKFVCFINITLQSGLLLLIQNRKENISPTIECKAPFSDRHNQIQHIGARMCQQYPGEILYSHPDITPATVTYTARKNEFNSKSRKENLFIILKNHVLASNYSYSLSKLMSFNIKESLFQGTWSFQYK